MIKKILNKIAKHFPILYDYYCKYIKNNLFHPIDKSICQLRIDFLKDFTFYPYGHLAFLQKINELYGLENKKVFELGGSNAPREILLDDFKMKQYIAVDYINSWWPDPNHKREKIYELSTLKENYQNTDSYKIYSGKVNDIPYNFLENTFDIVYTISTIEHFDDLKLILEIAYHVLKKGGVFIATSEPLWSSAKGHHFYLSDKYNFQTYHEFDWAHLLYNEDEFKKLFSEKDSVEKVAEQIYRWNGLNRVFYKEIIEHLNNSKFSKKKIINYLKQKPSKDTVKKLYKKYKKLIFNKKDFSIRGIQFILEK